MSYQMTEQDWAEITVSLFRDGRSLQAQFDTTVAEADELRAIRDEAQSALDRCLRLLTIKMTKIGLIGEVMAELHKDEKAAT